MSVFTTPFEQLPASLPVFPLANAIVMPGCQLPLNIFEPRYLNMVFDALGADRLIGMVQPDPTAPEAKQVAVYGTGTAGRIVSFSETQDGRLLIVLTGVCRFGLGEEIATTRGYRRFVADWSRFAGDYDFDGPVAGDNGSLMGLLRQYFERKGLETNWESIEQMSMPLLVNVLAGQLPFDPPERQALVETVDPEERIRRLVELLEFEVMGTFSADGRRH